jgi:hypothetical protein
MIGVDPLQLGKASFQVTFSSVLHLSGRFFSALVPFKDGPRHCGQLSARATSIESSATIRARKILLRKFFAPYGNVFIVEQSFKK